ncbi:DUF3073 domain-containing protein [Saxibacter everestensis]|uniref:DUF3073 domain-containing protein n=1 Tax=Saxibacter everestensis TaxID=2909229 RepID=A0ABY8QUF7_9MICO|nr:DUF3073 domain-containing protein [Brevibacteriaceae bacterium ZFBP1038]
MGRGRAKAKQTKVARKLKYYSPDTDYTALERELGGTDSHPPDTAGDEEYSDYDAYASKYTDDDDHKWASGGR